LRKTKSATTATFNVTNSFSRIAQGYW